MDQGKLWNSNARIYDPQLARFVSADPTMPNDYLDQLLDRYIYVADNPLSLTDPTGLCFLGCISNSAVFTEVLAIVVVVVLQQYEVLPELEGSIFSMTTAEATSEFGLLNAGILGGVGGLISTGNLKGGLLGSAEAMAFFEVGGAIPTGAAHEAEHTAERFVAHGLIGGLVSVAENGNFGSGFLSAGVGSLAPAPTTRQKLTIDEVADGTAVSSILGGVGSVLGGGKFENGAITGAFGYLFNALAHHVTISKRDLAYLDKYYVPVAAGAEADDVNVAYVLGVGVESGFASTGTYLRTGDAFAMTGGSIGTMEYFGTPEQNVSAWFRQWGARVYGDLDSIAKFLNDLEGEDLSGAKISGLKRYNTVNPGWKPFIAGGVLQMQRELPTYLQMRHIH